MKKSATTSCRRALVLAIASGCVLCSLAVAQQPKQLARASYSSVESSVMDSQSNAVKASTPGAIETADKGSTKQLPGTSSASLASAPQPTVSRRGCVAVTSVGSHIVRNTILWGATGALLSREQYQVVDAVDYPARIGEKFHGNDLQTIGSSARVVVLSKHFTADELHKACQ